MLACCMLHRHATVLHCMLVIHMLVIHMLIDSALVIHALIICPPIDSPQISAAAGICPHHPAAPKIKIKKRSMRIADRAQFSQPPTPQMLA
jgi:hypothetical protein